MTSLELEQHLHQQLDELLKREMGGKDHIYWFSELQIYSDTDTEYYYQPSNEIIAYIKRVLSVMAHNKYALDLGLDYDFQLDSDLSPGFKFTVAPFDQDITLIGRFNRAFVFSDWRENFEDEKDELNKPEDFYCQLIINTYKSIDVWDSGQQIIPLEQAVEIFLNPERYLFKRDISQQLNKKKVEKKTISN